MLRWQFKTRIRKLKLWETHTQSQIVHNASSFICHTIKSRDSTKLPQCLAFLRAFHKSVFFFQKLICFFVFIHSYRFFPFWTLAATSILELKIEKKLRGKICLSKYVSAIADLLTNPNCVHICLISVCSHVVSLFRKLLSNLFVLG